MQSGTEKEGINMEHENILQKKKAQREKNADRDYNKSEFEANE